MKKAATAALIALVTASITLPVSAQQAASAATPAAKATVPTAKPVVQAEEEEAASAPKKPGQEGIKVHGHWVMDLKDKDGKVIEHRDFQNSLDRNNGTNLLIDLLIGTTVGGNMENRCHQEWFYWTIRQRRRRALHDATFGNQRELGSLCQHSDQQARGFAFLT